MISETGPGRAGQQGFVRLGETPRLTPITQHCQDETNLPDKALAQIGFDWACHRKTGFAGSVSVSH